MFEKKTDVHDPVAEKSHWKRALVPCVLLAAVFVSSFGASFAMFRSTAKMELGTAGVAAYAVSAGASTSSDLSIDCNTSDNSEEYQFWVKNSNDGKTAEVAVQYDVQVALSEALPDGLTMKLDGIDGTADADGKVYTFASPDWTFKADVEETADHALQFTADASVVENDLTISGVVITVMTEQIN